MSVVLGLIVNPVAGVGGPAGLKGSDGAEVQRLAAERGSSAKAGERAAAALAVVAAAHPGASILTVGGRMGENGVRAAGLTPVVVTGDGETGSHWGIPDAATTAADTTAAAIALARAGATLILFAGGDGTARDVCAGLTTPDVGFAAGSAPLESEVAAVGIPAGVKMYSSCFAVSPQAAGALAADWMRGPLPTQEAEVLDVVEEQLRHGRVDPRLYGYLRIPVHSGRTQARKSASPASAHAAVVAAARGVVRELRPGVRYLLGPGSTVAEVARQLGVIGTPLGVDVLLDGEIVCADASEHQLLEQLQHGPARAIVTVIGGQGFVLGRGNQQISARVVRALGDEPLIVVAPEQKLIELGGRPLLVDTGDAILDARLAGFVRVVTGAASTSFYPVKATEDLSEPSFSEPTNSEQNRDSAVNN